MAIDTNLYPAVHIVTRSTGGGHFDAHISIATITGLKVVVVNDGTAKQLYEALREVFEPTTGDAK